MDADTTVARLHRTARSALRSRLFWIWIGVWIVTRALMVVQVGYWNHAGANYQDAGQYQQWSEQLAFMHVMPIGESWQYPPGAAFLILLPRAAVSLLGAPYPSTFAVSMLLVDLAGLALMALLAKRTGRNVGVWVWLLAIPVMQSYPILHFDLVPTVIAMAALIVIHRRPNWFGALAGLGAVIKVWPAVLLFGEWDRRRLLRSSVVAAGIIALAFGLAAVFFGSQSGFFDNQDVRGWLAGLSAVILTAGTRRMARPAWVVIGAVVITAGLYQAPANMIIRNMALVVAGVDAAIAMFGLLRGRSVCGRYTTPTRRSMRIA